MSDSWQPHGLQPARLLHQRDFPGKSTGVGCHCLLQGVRIYIKKTKFIITLSILTPRVFPAFALCVFVNSCSSSEMPGPGSCQYTPLFAQSYYCFPYPCSVSLSAVSLPSTPPLPCDFSHRWVAANMHQYFSFLYRSHPQPQPHFPGAWGQWVCLSASAISAHSPQPRLHPLPHPVSSPCSQVLLAKQCNNILW